MPVGSSQDQVEIFASGGGTFPQAPAPGRANRGQTGGWRFFALRQVGRPQKIQRHVLHEDPHHPWRCANDLRRSFGRCLTPASGCSGTTGRTAGSGTTPARKLTNLPASADDRQRRRPFR